MPWQDNSGNRGGGGGRGPWGQPPRGNNGGSNNNGGGRNEPPDLEDLLQASRQRLKRAFPKGGRGGGSGGGGFQLNKGTAGMIGGALLLLWGASGIYQVAPEELAVVTTFGDYSDVKGPGLHWHVPMPVQNVRKQPVLSLQDMQIPATGRRSGQLPEGLMLTGDKNIVDIAFTVQWRIKSALVPEQGEDMPGVAQFTFNIDDPESLVRMTGEAAMREVVGKNTLDYVQTDGRTEVASQTQALMQSALDSYLAGIQVERVNLTLAEPPTNDVNEAFRDVQAAEQNQATVIQQARQYTNQVVPEARGEAQRILEEARAYASERTANARGAAARFNEIYSEYAQAPEVTRQRMYLETVERVLGDMDKIIIEEGAGSGVVPYLPLDQLNRRQQQSNRQQGDN
ncbi:FtsH protease activity modulator HflK [Hyphococcus flavus]|uniref:Protein HflK n=1 Tax=Hyphococcus flavus TaxID=1866326 RepID=A0AAE9ZC17_9PROT|nr:FtsH protease activity modulator HflK [Hyphococcus flavus]WDI32063.1 FtsH protease activity modulator HflK [Hyphococcus flavus]